MGLKEDLVEKRGILKQRRKKLHEVWTQAGDEMDFSKVTAFGEGKSSRQNLDETRKLNEEVDAVQIEVEDIVTKIKAEENSQKFTEPPAPTGDQPAVKELGDLFVESGAYKAWKEQGHQMNKIATLDVGLKTLFETSAGWAPETTRTGRMVDYATRPIQVMDLVPMGSTGQNAVVYMEETTFVNNAAETDEGGTFQEAQLELTEQSSPVRKIAVWIPITDEQLEDVPQARSYVQNRLRFMIRQRIDNQILNGDGSAPNLTGILEVSGLQSQAKGSDPLVDAVYKAMVNVMTNAYTNPTAVILHPLKWQDVRLLRTTDGIYIWGNPSESGPTRLWGLPVVQAHVMPQTSGLTGDFANQIEWTERRGIDVQITDSHSDFFINGKQAVRADMRAALPIYRPSAFCEVTGL